MLTQIAVSLNSIANPIGQVLLAPIEWLPGWLSATLIGVVTGVLMLVVFKYTSNQSAIKRTRDQIKANMLALSLFKDDLGVSLRSQGRLLTGALRLILHALIPLAVLMIPMILILGQMSLWYQARPLRIGEESVVTVQLADESTDAVQAITLNTNDAVEVIAGPVRVSSKNMVCWKVMPIRDGQHQLEFKIGGETSLKEFVVGGAFEPTSQKRPAWDWNEVVMHPRETPFAPDSIVQSIEVTYPQRDALTAGTNNWVIYWFVISMVAAFVAKPFLNVNL